MTIFLDTTVLIGFTAIAFYMGYNLGSQRLQYEEFKKLINTTRHKIARKKIKTKVLQYKKPITFEEETLIKVKQLSNK